MNVSARTMSDPAYRRAALELLAEERHTTLHAIMREAVLSVLRKKVA